MSSFDEKGEGGVELEDVTPSVESNPDEPSKSLDDLQSDVTFALWAKRAAWVCYVSIIFSFLFGIAGVIVASWGQSVSLLGYAIESFLNVTTSLVVLWRFQGTWRFKEDEGIMYKREKKASVLLALLFLILASIVILNEILYLATENYPYTANAIIIVSSCSMLIFIPLAFIKFRIALALKSIALRKDALCSLCFGIISVGVFITAVVFVNFPDIWWLDAIITVIVSLALICYGSFTLIHSIVRDQRWYLGSFWRT